MKVHWGYVAAPIPPALVGAVDVEESGTKECESGSVGVWQPAKVNPPPPQEASYVGASMNHHPAQGRAPALRALGLHVGGQSQSRAAGEGIPLCCSMKGLYSVMVQPGVRSPQLLHVRLRTRFVVCEVGQQHYPDERERERDLELCNPCLSILITSLISLQESNFTVVISHFNPTLS